jgi:hypothetical protein
MPCSIANALSSSMSGSISEVKIISYFMAAFTSARRTIFTRCLTQSAKLKKRPGNGPALTLVYSTSHTARLSRASNAGRADRYGILSGTGDSQQADDNAHLIRAKIPARILRQP